MQGVLGIANVSSPEAPTYKQGIMTHAGDAFLADTSAPLYNGAPYTDTPAYTGRAAVPVRSGQRRGPDGRQRGRKLPLHPLRRCCHCGHRH